jgi:hypothetical protein
MTRKDEKTIGFRVDKTLLSRLEEAAKRAGISPHEWAKRATVRELDNQNQIPKIALQTEAIKQELVELRKDFAVATEGILVSVGKSSELASKFVKENLKGS